jgi:LysR family hca operon transcriptional activator
MELRHLRYFVAVAEERSLTLAAERRLHTAQPSLSRQIRDLEREVGVALFARKPHGVELTPAGEAFLHHARLALTEVESATESARRAGQRAKESFAIGFLTGREMEWLPEVMRVLGDELSRVELTFSSNNSPSLADALTHGKLDAAFLREEAGATELVFRRVARDPIVVVLPQDHRLAAVDAVDPHDLSNQPFVAVSNANPVLRATIDEYLRSMGVHVTVVHEADNLASAISMLISTRGVGLSALYIQNLLPAALTTRPLAGSQPTIDLVLGYHRANTSPILQRFLSNMDSA